MKKTFLFAGIAVLGAFVSVAYAASKYSPEPDVADQRRHVGSVLPPQHGHEGGFNQRVDVRKQRSERRVRQLQWRAPGRREDLRRCCPSTCPTTSGSVAA